VETGEIKPFLKTAPPFPFPFPNLFAFAGRRPGVTDGAHCWEQPSAFAGIDRRLLSSTLGGIDRKL
jgi:hypothetical protein